MARLASMEKGWEMEAFTRKNKTRRGGFAALAIAGTLALGAGASIERIADFGTADTGAGNTFWNVAGYNGGSVCRAASDVIDGFDSRYYTKSATLKFKSYKRGMLVIVF